jgi:hypothetical protein
MLLGLLLAIISFSTMAQGQGLLLSPEAKVSLITVGPGQELYSSFGHSALWIQDPINGLDYAYSYGTFNFSTEGFYIKFLRGTLPYQLSVSPLLPQLYYWQAENRFVKEQILDLSPSQKQALFAFLEQNYRPENREYQYKFFFDNCSTRLKDALKAACGDSLQLTGYTAEQLSFRQWIDRYAYRQKPWADFGMDLAIGAPSDEIATPEQATFLPDNLSAAFDEARLLTDSTAKPLVLVTRDLYVATPGPSPFWLTPMLLFWALAVAVGGFTYWQLDRKHIHFGFDRVLFTLLGLVGVLILLLWFGTDHGVTSLNYDILWASPIWLVAIWMLSRRAAPTWFQLWLIVYTVLMLAATTNLSKHNQVLIPILVIIACRVYYLNNTVGRIGKQD